MYRTKDLRRFLLEHGWTVKRNGGNHQIWTDPTHTKTTIVSYAPHCKRHWADHIKKEVLKCA